jgi:hypothetical protein
LLEGGPVRVKVTEEHIKAGVRCCGNRCPIALAILEQAPDFAGASVGNGIVSLWRDPPAAWAFAALDREAYRFLRYFDGGLPVEPFEFDLNLYKSPP